MSKKIIVTGGAGYVGAVLVPMLLKKDYKVTVLDLFIFGNDVIPDHPNLTLVKGDIRDEKLLRKIIPGHEIIIHMACISNDPSFDKIPRIGKKINLDCFRPLVEICKEAKLERFLNTSSSSVFGLKDEQEVTEDLPLDPLTGYSKFKADCEKILLEYKDEDFVVTSIRPATVCGYSKRQRLDVVVNLLTNFAINKRKITIFGGDQLRPNIHIKDLSRVFIKLVEADKKIINGESFNAGSINFKVKEIAEIVKKIVGEDIEIITQPTDDNRSYHISSKKLEKLIDFKCEYRVEDAVSEIKEAFNNKLIDNPELNDKFFNVKMIDKFH